MVPCNPGKIGIEARVFTLCSAGHEPADNLFMTVGRNVVRQMVQNCAIVPNRFLATRATGYDDAFAALGDTRRVFHKGRQVVTPDFLL
jgi:hypothetical protein